MKEISISKSTCLAVVADVQKSGVPVRITRFGKSMADVLPPLLDEGRAGQIGALQGTISFPDDLVEVAAIGEVDWESMET